MSVRIKKSFQMLGVSLAMSMSLSVSLSVLGAGQVSAQGLQAAMEAAYENSDLLEQNRYLARVSDEGIAQRVAALRPTLNMVAQRARTDAAGSLTETIALTADLVLFASGSRSAQIAAARASAEATQAQLLGLEGQVLLDAVTAYMNVWRDVQVVNVRQSNLRVVEEQLRAARDRFDLGEATRTDVAQAEAQMAAAR
ncbi:MAG: TolC family protein, partial [Paracoccaceae bacterium]